MRYLIGIVLVILLLTGCREDTVSPPHKDTANATVPEETLVSSIVQESTYIPNSAMERETDGAVRMYCPDVKQYIQALAWGDRLLVVSGTERTTLTLMDKDTMSVVAQAELDCLISGASGGVQVTDDGIIYFCCEKKQVVFADVNLNEICRVNLPKNLLGGAVVSPNGEEVFYCTTAGVHVMDFHTGITRLLKEQEAEVQMVTGIYFDGAVLGCYVKQSDDFGKNTYISAQTGETLHDNAGNGQLYTDGSLYFSQMKEGTMDLYLAGNDSGEIQRLDVPDGAEVIPALPMGGVIIRQEGGKLSLIELEHGRCRAELTADGLEEARFLGADENMVWFSLWDKSQNAACIYAWNPDQNPVDDSTCYLMPYYTADKPDLEGLQACKALAHSMEDQYGVTILIWEDALTAEDQGFSFEPEYRVDIYQRNLTVLEQVLQRFPEGFFRQTLAGSNRNGLTVCLVRSLNSDDPSVGPEIASGAQYYLEDSACIVLAVGQSLEAAFYHQLSHLLDSRVISTCDAYDDWQSMNPWTFEYDMDYEKNSTREAGDYLDRENRLFIDTYSMSFPKEDRARILEYAMMAGNQHYFISEQMQRKLETICMALRETFDLSPDQRYIWEQYLIPS